MNERVWTKGPVLIVEDHADSLQMICDWLEAMGIPCVTAPDGRAALHAVHEYRPSVILLDISMPDMDGIDFRRAQLGLPDSALARIPIVLLTALPDHRRYASELGAMAAIQKPVDIYKLLTLVRRIDFAVRGYSAPLYVVDGGTRHRTLVRRVRKGVTSLPFLALWPPQRWAL